MNTGHDKRHEMGRKLSGDKPLKKSNKQFRDQVIFRPRDRRWGVILDETGKGW